jgi:hypothetical protein
MNFLIFSRPVPAFLCAPHPTYKNSALNPMQKKDSELKIELSREDFVMKQERVKIPNSNHQVSPLPFMEARIREINLRNTVFGCKL